MELRISSAEVYVPNGSPEETALASTTHMGISAHHDDTEIIAYHGILECFGKIDRHFTGVVVTNGSGSPRDDLYATYTDEEMMRVRRIEQKKAATIGDYAAQVFMDYTSAAVKEGSNLDVVEDLKSVITTVRPRIIYTHNLADKHDTHVAVALRVIRAIRNIPADARPEKLYGCEVWRDLDWLNDDDKVVFNVEAHENLAAALLGVFDSQICGGKRYDLATMGRRRANATYFASHGVDESASLIFGMDLTPLIEDHSLDPSDYANRLIEQFAADVTSRIARLD